MQITTEFYPLKGFAENYFISKQGEIKTTTWRGSKREAVLKPAKDKKGYLRFGLIHNGKLKTFKAHRLVAEQFIYNPLNKPQVNHINGIKTDNRVENLEWVTQSENTIHSFKNKLQISKSGNEFHRTKYSDEFVLMLKEELKNGASKRALSRKYKVDRNIFKRKILCQ